MDIMIKPEMELLSVLEFLGGCFPEFIITPFEFKYKDEIKRYFSRYRGHKCVRLYKQICNQGFNFDAPVKAILHLSSFPDMEVKIPFDEYLIRKARGKDKLFILVKEISNFAVDTRFMDFFHLHKNFYSSLVGSIKKELKETYIVERLEEYFGFSQTSYTIIPVTLFCGFFGPSIEDKDGKSHVFAIIGPTGIDNDRNPIFARDRTEFFCLHEFSHSFVNPITARFMDRLKSYEHIFKPISEKMAKLGYFDWESCISEHIVRAIVGRIYFSKDIEARKNLLEEETKRGFIYIKYIDKKLNEYEDLRERYSTFEDFYPELVDLWENLYSRNKPLGGKHVQHEKKVQKTNL